MCLCSLMMRATRSQEDFVITDVLRELKPLRVLVLTVEGGTQQLSRGARSWRLLLCRRGPFAAAAAALALRLP